MAMSGKLTAMSVNCFASCRIRDSLPEREIWRPKLRTAAAMTRLCWAQLLVSWIPFKYWRHRLGFRDIDGNRPSATQADARRLAADVQWAAKRLPFETKCLPRAMALSWILRRKRIGHTVVIAVRPSEHRQSPDALHAWVEVDGGIMLGDLPGPWVETLRLDG
ncbi:MAG TPA: lasso peptide biosynthesis B2 protein [Sphingomicrobium sp.]|nr:lasso peptide biosynthesis B2 protein [Sphingomicrobium sp.]